jgi:hypothetical protein
VAFASKPKTAKELQDILFGGLETMAHPYDDVSYPAKIVAEAVFEELKGLKAASKEEIVDAVKLGWFEGRPEFKDEWDARDAQYGKDKWEAYEKKCRTAAAEVVNKFLAGKEGMEFFVLEFSDETKFGSMLEHGGVFDGVPHLLVSNH